MTGFAVVLNVVAVIALAVATAAYFRSRSAPSRLGQGTRGFSHAEDVPVSERPSEDQRDAPLPDRPVRGRP